MADYYIDFTAGSTITGTWTFTNGSAGVSANSDGAATTELAVGNYVRVSNGSQWYKVNGITDDNNIVLFALFGQATITDTTDGSLKNAGDGSSGTPWAHPRQASTDNIRTAGDIVHFQNGQTLVLHNVDWVFDESGTAVAPITYISDDWKGLSNSTPYVLDFDSTSHGIYCNGRDYLIFKNFTNKNSQDSSGAIVNTGSGSLLFEDCDFTDCYIGTYTYDGHTYFKNCNFTGLSNKGISLYNGGRCIMEGGSIEGSSAVYGVWADLGVKIFLRDVEIGQVSALNFDFYMSNSSVTAELFNCKWDSSKIGFESAYDNMSISSYNHNQVEDAYFYKHSERGAVEKDTVEVRAGGASSCVKASPAGSLWPGLEYKLLDWVEEAVAAAAQTRTVYIKSKGLSSTFPTATQLWLQAEYLDAATGSSRTTVKSTAVISVDDTYTAFAVNFTPAQVGKVHYKVFCGVYISGGVYYVDNQLN